MAKEEKLVVEVVAAHNLMPKDGQGSSSPFVEVEFEHQKRKTRPKYKDLNPVWNETLVFPVTDPADFPYRFVDVAVYNERCSASSRNFLGKVRISASGIPSPGEEAEAVPQLFTLEKRSLFSHIRGDISLKIYRTTSGAVTVTEGNNSSSKQKVAKAKQQKNSNNNNHVPDHGSQAKQQISSGGVQLHHNQQNPNQKNHHHHHQQGKNQQHPQQGKQLDPSPIDVTASKPPVILTAGAPVVSDPFPYQGFSANGQDFSLKETSPHLGGVAANRDKTSSTYDLVEQMQYLYVRVVRARDLHSSTCVFEALSSEVKLGNYRGITRSVPSCYWDQVFAFSKDCIQSSIVEVFVKEKEDREEYLGRLALDLSEVPKRVPPDSTLAPQWYRMEDKKGDKSRVEIMLSAWFGTQADEAFSEAWHSRAAGVQGDGLGSIKSKVYLSPKLWYLRVTIIEAQDLLVGDKSSGGSGRFPEISAKAQVGNQILRTRASAVTANRSPTNPFWNEDLMFVVAEPFEDYLVVWVDDLVGPGREEVLGRVVIPVAAIERRVDGKVTVSRWLPLDRSHGGGDRTGGFGSRVHLRLCLDGGYHVLDESTAYSSDLRPTAKQLWKPHVGVLEMGILGASGLVPVKIKDGKGASADPYCVAKYGSKWVRTRTVVDSVSPRWNEQYTWEVFDPCTVVTIGVFDNSHVGRFGSGHVAGIRDARIGKVRIRLSTLEADRVYTHAYPLLMLHPSGVKKMGDLHLAVRFSCANFGNLLHLYGRPLLPKMHYVEPLSVRQVENLRYQATNVVAARLSRAEPPLGREVVEYMLDHGSNLWSMRRSKANFFRLVAVLSGPIAVSRWIDSLRNWQCPVHSAAFALAYAVFLTCPELILPVVFVVLAVIGLWRYRLRPRHPPHMDMRLSQAESAYTDELDEEFDTFPSSRSGEVVRMRYDRLRSVAGRVQMVVGDLGTQGERLQALLGWRDPRTTFLFLVFCLAAAVVFYAVPLRVIVGLWGAYSLRPPRFRSRLPSPAMSFFRRLPTKADSLL